MAELKTKKTEASVEEFLNGVADETRRRDCFTLLDMMKKITRKEPKMWGASMVGLGEYEYKYASGRESVWFPIGFSPRKQDLTIYVVAGYERFPELMQKLGKYKTGKSCLYIKKLEDLDMKVLKQLLTEGYKALAGSKAKK
ncbi:MAG: DUF1801 domain-containing protein [Blastocatellia bacterium]|nr:DUF1801 domain-containing protein [Blastocatellia bacterium]